MAPKQSGDGVAAGAQAAQSSAQASASAFASVSALASASVKQTIHDGRNDIASRVDGARMRVEATGRRMYQKGVWIWTSSNVDDDTKEMEKYDSYVVATHGPKSGKWKHTPNLPAGAEFVPHDHAYERMEIGLIDGANLDVLTGRDEGSTTSRNKTVEEKRKREPLDRADHALRVFTPITLVINDQTKYLVGCMPQGGRLQGKKIKRDLIFFYPEYWSALSPNANVNARRSFIGPAIGKEAAQSKEHQARPTAAITPDAASKWTSSNPLAVTEAEDLAATVRLHYSVGALTGEADHFATALAFIEHAAPDLKDGPQSSNGGVSAFFTYSEEMSEDEAEALSKEMAITHEFMPAIKPELILAIHAVLRQEQEMAEKLAPSLLPFFLDLCQTKVLIGDYKDEEYVRRRLPNALEIVEIHGRHLQSLTSSKVVSLNNAQLVRILAASQELIKKTAAKLWDDAIAIIQQHGGVRQCDSLTGLVKQAAKAVDVRTQHAFLSQIAAVNAGQYAVSFRAVSETLKAHAAKLARVLKHLSPAADEDEATDG